MEVSGAGISHPSQGERNRSHVNVETGPKRTKSHAHKLTQSLLDNVAADEQEQGQNVARTVPLGANSIAGHFFLCSLSRTVLITQWQRSEETLVRMVFSSLN